MKLTGYCGRRNRTDENCAHCMCAKLHQMKWKRRATAIDGGGRGSSRKQLHYRTTWYSFKLDAAFMFRFYVWCTFFSSFNRISVLFAARKARDNLTVIWTHCTYLHLEGSANRHSGKLHTICGRSVLTKKTTTIKKSNQVFFCKFLFFSCCDFHFLCGIFVQMLKFHKFKLLSN